MAIVQQECVQTFEAKPGVQAMITTEDRHKQTTANYPCSRPHASKIGLSAHRRRHQLHVTMWSEIRHVDGSVHHGCETCVEY